MFRADCPRLQSKMLKLRTKVKSRLFLQTRTGDYKSISTISQRANCGATTLHKLFRLFYLRSVEQQFGYLKASVQQPPAVSKALLSTELELSLPVLSLYSAGPLSPDQFEALFNEVYLR